MQKVAPLIYEEDNLKYRIDDCLPQREAIQQGKIGFHVLVSLAMIVYIFL